MDRELRCKDMLSLRQELVALLHGMGKRKRNHADARKGRRV